MRKLLALVAMVALALPLAACRENTTGTGTKAGVPAATPTATSTPSPVKSDGKARCETSKLRCK